MGEREAARQFGISRESVRKMLSFSVPPGYRRKAPVKRPKLDGFIEIIDAWLAEDQAGTASNATQPSRYLSGCGMNIASPAAT